MLATAALRVKVAFPRFEKRWVQQAPLFLVTKGTCQPLLCHLQLCGCHLLPCRSTRLYSLPAPRI